MTKKDGKVLQMTRPGMQEAMENIMDIFLGGEDLSDCYMFFQLCSSMDKQAANGNEDAIEVLSCIPKFSLLIDSAKKLKTRLKGRGK